MLKVIIADDEPKVCQLIFNLINWDELGMEVVAISNDGEVAFHEICEKQPDIVITDIRMPTYDGIELIRRTKEKFPNIFFIIISGYSQFEYAQQAIKYGVEDYLLKPLKKAELRKALEKIAEKHHLMAVDKTEKENLRTALHSSSQKAKKNLIWEMLNTPGNAAWGKEIDEINSDYCCHLTGPFFAAVVRPYPRAINYSNEMYHMLLSKLQLLVEKRLHDCCSEMISTIWDHEIVCFIDSYNASMQEIDKNMQKSIRDAFTLKGIFKNFDVVVGVGHSVNTVKQLLDSYNAAKAALNDRVVYPGQAIIHSAPRPEGEAPPLFDTDTRDAIISRFEHMDFNGVLKEINKIKFKVNRQPYSGDDVFDCYRRIIETVFFSAKSYFTDFSLSDMNFFLKSYHFMLSVDQIFDWLITELSAEFDHYLLEKEYKESKPIVLAKQYINQNYKASISLENVSAAIGFNPAYFSSLFKKETGKNFLEYVTEIRINNAKSYLAKTDMNISDIAFNVGYTDIKYFSKLFKRNTGLSPSEYRKLFS